MELEHLTRNFRIKNLDGFERDETDARAGLLNVKEKGITMCYIMNRCLVMSLRGEKVNVVHYRLFCCQCKDKFLLETG